jgi:thiamine transporter
MFETFAKTLTWVTLVLLVLGLVAGILVKTKKPTAFPSFFKYAVGGAVGYAVALGAALFTLSWWSEKKQLWKTPDTGTFVIFALALLVAALAIVGIVLSYKKRSALKIYTLAALAAVAVYVIVIFIVFPITADGYRDAYTGGETAGLVLSVLAAAAILIGIPAFLGKKTPAEKNTRSIVYAAICIALGFALSYLKLFSLPQGGSITVASLLPLMIYSYIFGIRKGASAGFIYGILQFIQEPYFLDPWQFVLEYPLAFGLIGLAGIFHELKIFNGNAILQLALGGIVVAVLRFLCHFIAGIIVWGHYAPEGTGAVVYSLTYNLSYVFPDMAIALVAGAAMLASKSFKATIDRITV